MTINDATVLGALLLMINILVMAVFAMEIIRWVRRNLESYIEWEKEQFKILYQAVLERTLEALPKAKCIHGTPEDENCLICLAKFAAENGGVVGPTNDSPPSLGNEYIQRELERSGEV